jgi:hypothetical protein
MNAAAQAVRPKHAPASPEVRRCKKPKQALLSASPRYLRASMRLGGRHDPEEREAERAASTIAAGGCHRVPDPGGSTHLLAAGADAPVARAASASTPAVVDPGASGRVRRAATHEAVDPGGSHSLRASPTSSASDIRARAEPSAEPVRALHDPGGADYLRAAAAPPVVDPGASGRVRRSPAAQSGESEHVHPMMSAGAGDADAEAAHRIDIARGTPARPLPATVRSRLEHGFGEPMASVRVDTSPAARAAAAAIGARAYAEGERITLGRGESEHDLGLMAHEATHVVQNRRAGHRGHGAATPSTEIRREIQAASDSDDSRTYRMLDGRTIELPDDMTAEEAHRLEMEGLAAKRRLGHGPPPMPVPEVHKPADKSKTKKAAVKVPHHGVAGPAGRHAHGPRSVGVVAKLHPEGGVVGRYLIAKAMPVLARGIAKLGVLSRHQQTHYNAGQKVHQAENAVKIPPSEGQSKSNFNQVNAVAERPAPAIDENKGKDKLVQSLAQNVPHKVEDVDNFKRDMKAQHTAADVLKVVQADKNAVVVTFADMETTPPPIPPEHKPVALPPQEVAPATPAMNLGKETIAQLLPQHTDLSQYTKDADARLREEGVTQEQLDMVDSGDLAEANKEKKGLEKAAKTEPLAVQQFAQNAASQVDRDLRRDEKTERDALAARRRHGLNETGHQQEHAKTALEKKRDDVAAHINCIYQTAQDSVTKKLNDLEKKSMQRFDDGNARAAKVFEDDVHSELDAFKKDRYSGWFGWTYRAHDWLISIDDLPDVKAIFEDNKDVFVRTIKKLVELISADNKRVVQECKDELTQARADIKKCVDKLGPKLKGIAEQTAGEVNGKLDALDDTIRKKEEELQQKLADKQQAAIKAIDEKVEKMKEDMAGAFARLGRLAVKAAKKFFVWALEKFGYSLSDIESIIDKGIAVLKEIFTHPIQFVKHLIAAAKQGFFNFRDHFVDHLKDAIFDWLTGSLEGITLPTSWDLKGIASVALQLIGVSWSHIRAKLVARIPEPVVASLETGFDLVDRLRHDPMAAWEKLQEMGEDIKQAFIEGVTNFIEVKIVWKAIETIVEFFVPGAGIVRAIIGIYDTIVFFIQKAKQILEMVGNFLGSIAEIAAGNIDAAADALEKGLARALLLAVNFLARFLHLDGITAKIRAAIEKLHDKVDGALERVADWVVDKAKIVGKLAVRAGAAVVAWWKDKVGFTNKDGESHSLQFAGEDASARLTIASLHPRPVEDFLRDYPDKNSAEYETAEKVFKKECKQKYRIIFTPQKRTEDERERRAGVHQALLAISEAFAKLSGNPPKAGDYPRVTERKYNPGVPPKCNTIEHLMGDASIDSKPKDGPNTGTAGWQAVWNANLTKQKRGVDKWVQMHVISDALGGPADPKNLISAPNSVNSGFRPFEHAVANLAKAHDKKKKGIRNVVWVSVHVSWYDAEFARAIQGQAGLYFWMPQAPDKWVKNERYTLYSRFEIARPDLLKHKKYSLNYTSATVLAKIMGKPMADLVKSNRLYSSMEAFQKRINMKASEAHIPNYKAKVAKIANDPNVVLGNVEST